MNKMMKRSFIYNNKSVKKLKNEDIMGNNGNRNHKNKTMILTQKKFIFCETKNLKV